jgi:hypothetical protein
VDRRSPRPGNLHRQGPDGLGSTRERRAHLRLRAQREDAHALLHDHGLDPSRRRRQRAVPAHPRPLRRRALVRQRHLGRQRELPGSRLLADACGARCRRAVSGFSVFGQITFEVQ